MLTLGLLGGTSWESTAIYYRLLNEMTKARVGETHSCPLLLYSFDFAPIREYSFAENWDAIGDLMSQQAVKLEAADAGAILICANTIHRVADQVQSSVKIPLINLIDSVEAEAKRLGAGTIGVLGTRYTMDGEFYVGRLRERGGLNVLVPNDEDRAYVNAAIYDEMVLGEFRAATRTCIAEICEKLRADGAEAIVLGCTELPILLKPEDCLVPFLDTTLLHCQVAIDFALSSSRS